MEIVKDTTRRILLPEGKDRRRKLLNLFYKYIGEDITIMDTHDYEALIKENARLISQLKMINELRQAELDRQDVHRR